MRRRSLINGTRQLRCAIYPGKPTVGGLHQEFNSLGTQRESAEAFSAAQRAAISTA